MSSPETISATLQTQQHRHRTSSTRKRGGSIVIPADDVAIRTSNYNGTTLRQLDTLGGAWIDSFGSVKDCVFAVMLDAADDFQSATYTAMTGYYRLSISALRSALELTAIGVWAQVCGKRKEFHSWRSGKITLSFGQACDGLPGAAGPLEAYLRSAIGDSLFAQKNSVSGDEGGYARRIYSGISNFSHSRDSEDSPGVHKLVGVFSLAFFLLTC